MKKLLSVALSVILALGLSFGAFAANQPEMLGYDNFDPILGYGGKMITRLVKGDGQNYRVRGFYFDEESKRELDFVNEARAKKKLAPLKWEKKLEEPAIQRALEQYVLFSHTRPDGSNWSTISSYANGENLAISYGGYFDAEVVTEGWLESPGHYANIMGTGDVSKYFISMAAACVETDKGTIWVQLFRADSQAFLADKNKNRESGEGASNAVKTLSSATVSARYISSALDKAKAPDGVVSITLRGVGKLSTDAINAAFEWSESTYTPVTLTVTTPLSSGSSTQGKLIIDPTSLTGKKAIETGVYVEKSAVRSVNEFLAKKYPNADFTVIKLAQNGSYSGLVQVAVKAEKRLDDKLFFYSYDENSKRLKKLNMGKGDYSVDRNTFLYFYTDTGGYFVVSGKEL